MAGVHQHQSPAHDRAAEGHHDMIAQPHSEEEGPVAEAEILAATLLAGAPRRCTSTWRSSIQLPMESARHHGGVGGGAECELPQANQYQ
jgi:hypothetical protein